MSLFAWFRVLLLMSGTGTAHEISSVIEQFRMSSGSIHSSISVPRSNQQTISSPNSTAYHCGTIDTPFLAKTLTIPLLTSFTTHTQFSDAIQPRSAVTVTMAI
ncbi:hypothetical protein IWW34DRAFT_121345 [Fusarium oxysporum f. sp. albedinis]|nr:hypothetical protein IWW34DRAFT_121345 [Fusarium oxysporum f. sp. albedinis]